VLSGSEQPRQWHDAIGLLDVVRSAAAEIADFPRVELVGIDERIAVAGRAVSDVSHLLAELLENATTFSSPETAVVVSGALTKSGFVVAITDQGLGMAADRIAEANTLLRNPPVVGLALSRALGLHVVGALAKRHEIAVELRRTAAGGTVALVALPKTILEARGSDPTPGPVPPIYTPDVDERGAPAPLGARRVGARRAGPEERVPVDEPPVEQWRRETIEAEQAAASSATETAEPVESAQPVEPALPTRVPGANLSHTPAAAEGAPVDETDPLRAYRVHELLSRHTQGVRRGHTQEPPVVAEPEDLR